jgi:hypothetical protein
MANLKEVLAFLKSQTQAGRDAQELEEMQNMRQASIDAANRYENSPAREAVEDAARKKSLADALEMYLAPQRAMEARQRQESDEARKLLYQQEEDKRQKAYEKTMQLIGKKR